MFWPCFCKQMICFFRPKSFLNNWVQDFFSEKKMISHFIFDALRLPCAPWGSTWRRRTCSRFSATTTARAPARSASTTSTKQVSFFFLFSKNIFGWKWPSNSECRRWEYFWNLWLLEGLQPLILCWNSLSARYKKKTAKTVPTCLLKLFCHVIGNRPFFLLILNIVIDKHSTEFLGWGRIRERRGMWNPVAKLLAASGWVGTTCSCRNP